MARDKFLSASSNLSMAARLRRPDDSWQGRISLAVQRFGSRSSESWALPAHSADLLYRASITEVHRREIADPDLFEFNGSRFGIHTRPPQWLALVGNSHVALINDGNCCDG